MRAFIIDLIQSNSIFTDIMIEEDAPVMIKGPAGWVKVDNIMPPNRDDIGSVLTTLDSGWLDTLSERAINRPIDLSEWRLRINAYLAFSGTKVMMSIRKMPKHPIPLEKTGLPPSVRLLLEIPRGLILLAGPTGSGKTTSMAAMVDHVNEMRNSHIVTIEDPIEYLYERKKAVFSQREVGIDVGSFFEGARDAMRQRPDVIAIGEIRDRDTAETALIAAESGHLVMGTLHANSAPGAIQKILAFFGNDERDAKLQALTATLVGVISQTLLPTVDKRGYALASELLFNHKDQFAKILGDPDKVISMLERKEDTVSRTMVDSLVELVQSKRVAKADAVRAIKLGQASLIERLKNIA